MLCFILSATVRAGTGIVFRIGARRLAADLAGLPGRLLQLPTSAGAFREESQHFACLPPDESGARVRLTIILLAIMTTAVVFGAREDRLPSAPGLPLASPDQQPPERSLVGTLDQVDAAATQIVVKTPTGKQSFVLQSGATIRQGSKTIKASELGAHKGERVKVRYREAAGVRRAEWIVVASPPPSQSRKGKQRAN
jgi:hypothetical protein